jgi:predicted DNA-binding transcriptional regulator AlpA
MQDEAKLLLNEKEAAQLLSMSTHFLRRDRISCDSVGIPYVRIGASVRYRRVDLEHWIDRKLHEPSPKSRERMAIVDENPVARGRGRPRKIGPSPS